MSALPENHPPVKAPKIGVLLLNLGTPEAPTARAVKRYLAEFLSDKRVIDTPRLIWLPILHGIILNVRPRKSARNYAAIWNHEQNESPLKTHTRKQAEGIAAILAADYPNICVAWGMRYGNPSTQSAIESLLDQGATRILAFAVYPQYSATTTASAYDKVFDVLKSLKRQPAIRTAPAYHDNPLYISALAASVIQTLATLKEPPEAIVCSFHGLPQRYFDEGDPYHCFCQKTSRLLREQLGWNAARWHTSFQSRFGPTKWLEPYTDATLKRLASDGIKRVAIISPGFASDCIETLEELSIGLREEFLAASGNHSDDAFTYIPCLNSSTHHINMLSALIKNELSGWI